MRKIYLSLSILTFAFNVQAEDPFTTSLFVDTYSAYSRNDLINDERPYFTQAARNDDYHLNLASAGIGYDDGSYRGKLVGQYGDSVDINYNAEPQDSFKYIQESYFGAYINEKTYLDIGTFLAHIGAESWLSKDNINYTRSFIAEFSPYYETGVRLSHTFNDAWSGQLLLVNGWQNTTDDRHPAFGTQLAYTTEGYTITSNTFLGEENYDTRIFHDLIVSKKFDSGFKLLGSIDVGHESEESPASGTWWGYSAMAGYPLNETFSINTRFESYQDPHGVIVTSVTDEPFKAYGASLGLDINLTHGFALRTEAKRLWSSNDVFLDDINATDNDTIFVVSLSFFDEQKL